MRILYLNGLVRSRICGLGSGFCVVALPSSVLTDKFMAECGRNAPGVLKGYAVLKRSAININYEQNSSERAKPEIDDFLSRPSEHRCCDAVNQYLMNLNVMTSDLPFVWWRRGITGCIGPCVLSRLHLGVRRVPRLIILKILRLRPSFLSSNAAWA